MNLDLLLPMCMFAFVGSITPGPNNLMLLASGSSFGFKKSLSHIIGIVLGFGLMLFATGLGLNVLFETYPGLEKILKMVCVIFLLYLAYKITIASPASSTSKRKKPVSFFEALMFQWVNPKAWAVAISASSLFSSSGTLAPALFMSLVFTAINVPCVCVWCLSGEKISNLLKHPVRLRYFNYIMAALLLSCLGFLL